MTVPHTQNQKKSCTYPEPKDITCTAPESLDTFIHNVIHHSSKTGHSPKHEAIMQSIIAATRPRSFLSPLLLGIAVCIHRKYGSKDLIELLNNLGFSQSYWEVQWYEYSVMADQSDQQDPDGFLQHVFDNADFNIRTIDGHGTFHSMGGIQCSKPASNSGSVGATKRVLTPPEASVIGSYAEVPIKPYTQPPSKALSKLTIKDPIEHEVATTVAERFDVLWISGHTIQATPHSSWAWFMQSAMQNTGTYDVSEITTLPFINMDPSDCSTIYTTLCYARAQCDKAGQKTCFVTFDQPLYIKATEIVRSSPGLACVVVSLGGFHLLMSLMGAIGYIMSGSGLQELWESIYARNSVVQIISGHACNRALRAHFLTQQALASILWCPLMSWMRLKLHSSASSMRMSCMGSTDAVEDPAVVTLDQRMKDMLGKNYTLDKTAQLWIQYFSVTLVRNFIQSERTGDWPLHLDTIRRMLSFFHASGHLHFAKSAHLYHQEMCSLHDVMDMNEFQAYTEKGFFTIRHSDRFWSGVWSDMTRCWCAQWRFLEGSHEGEE